MTLEQMYVVWIAVGLPVLVAGWYTLGFVASVRARIAARSLLAAAVLGLAFVGSDGAAVPVPAMLFLIRTDGLLYGGGAMLFWWLVMFLLLWAASGRGRNVEG